MSFPNPNISDIIATTIEFRSPDIAENVLDNNAGLAYIKANNRVKMISGGSSILETLNFAENANGIWYSGADLLPVSAQDVISGASFQLSQLAVPVVVNGLEKLQNAGREQIIDLVDSRLNVSETTMTNLVSRAVYSDGTAFGGKQLPGLNVLVPTSPTSGTVGGINRATYPFWQPQLVAPGAGVITASNINTYMNDMWAKTQCGKRHPKLILADNAMWKLYEAYLQERTRFTGAETGSLGFPTLKFMNADVVLDGGIGGNAPANTMLFLNLDYLHYRPHRDRNMVPLNPGRRYAFNQDVEAQILVFAGAFTISGSKFQGRLHNN